MFLNHRDCNQKITQLDYIPIDIKSKMNYSLFINKPTTYFIFTDNRSPVLTIKPRPINLLLSW